MENQNNATAGAANGVVDLDNFNTITASNSGTEIELVHPTTHKPLGVFIGLLGKDSDAFRAHMRDKVNQRIRKESFAAQRNKRLDPMTAEQTEAEAVETLALCSTGWRTQERDLAGNLVDGTSRDTIRVKGEDLPFTPVNARRVYQEQLWIRRQVDEAIGDLENFIKA